MASTQDGDGFPRAVKKKMTKNSSSWRQRAAFTQSGDGFSPATKKNMMAVANDVEKEEHTALFLEISDNRGADPARHRLRMEW
ncbi:hypothetical protein ACLOJK_003451 [Asimina triloba]